MRPDRVRLVVREGDLVGADEASAPRLFRGEPAFDDLLAQGVAGTAFAFSTYRAKPGALAILLDSLGRRVADEESRGRRLVGAYEVAFTNDLAYAIWAHEALADLAGYEQQRTRDERLEGCDGFSEHWGFAVPGSPLWPKGRAGGAKVW